jgi:hypothetical protein
VVGGNPEFFFTDRKFCGWLVASPDEADRGDCCSGYSGWVTAWEANGI